jgi:hypothetical protein
VPPVGDSPQLVAGRFNFVPLVYAIETIVSENQELLCCNFVAGHNKTKTLRYIPLYGKHKKENGEEVTQ